MGGGGDKVQEVDVGDEGQHGVSGLPHRTKGWTSAVLPQGPPPLHQLPGENVAKWWQERLPHLQGADGRGQELTGKDVD